MYTLCVKERKHSTKKLRFKRVSYHQPPPPQDRAQLPPCHLSWSVSLQQVHHFFILLQVFICPAQCPCNKFIIFHFSFFCKFSFVLICAPATRSLRQLFICHLSWSGPYNKVLVPATWSWSLQQGHLMQFVICLVRCPCNKIISSSLSFLLISVICHLQVVKYPGPLKQLLKKNQ